MFYSDTLLSKTGPLAKIWLASHVERKLTKQQILQQDVSSSVRVIVDQGTAPIALRTSGQLMLGVVRIYGRQAKYLLEDCNDTLVKIRMIFKTTNNHDMPHQTSTTIDLNLPEQLTIDDLFPALDLGFAMTQQPSSQNEDRGIAYTDDWASTLEPHTQTPDRMLDDTEHGIIQDDDLGLDLGEDVGMDTTISMQRGRAAATPLAQDGTDLQIYDDGIDLDLDTGEDVGMTDITMREADEQPAAVVDDGDDETAQLRGDTARGDSPLSEPDPGFMADADRTFQQDQTLQEGEEEVVAQQRQVNRRAKPMLPDRETMLHNAEIKQQNADRSKILKPQSLLPQDPELLALMEMQRNGDFVTNAMNDVYGGAWAPEIQGLLSFDLVYRAGQKRKRDSGIADVASEDEHSDKSPRLDRDLQGDEEAVIDDEGVELRGSSPRNTFDDTHEPIAAPPETPALADIVPGEDDEGIYAEGGDGGFDETTMPLVHPADSGPISLGTQHAVHLLRDVFGPAAESQSPSSQSRKSVLLQDLIPEGRTTKADATKMFFETLVLATKDAIKVEQQNTAVGLSIRVRAKRGLWGAWAEPSTQQEVTQEA